MSTNSGTFLSVCYSENGEGDDLKKIRNLREEAGMTQLQLAVAIGVTPVTVYNWERGQHEPKASQVRALANVFGVSMDDIDFELSATSVRDENRDQPKH